MAQKCSCDKCKKIYSPEAQECGFIIVSVYDSNHSSWPGGNEYDFCPSCMVRIDKLIVQEIENG